MRGAALAAIAIGLGASLVRAGGQYSHWAQPAKGPRNKTGNSLSKSRKKQKARRTAQRDARRTK